MISSNKKLGLLLRKNYDCSHKGSTEATNTHPVLQTTYVLSECANSKCISLSMTPFFGSTFQLDCEKARWAQRESNLTGEISERLKKEQINELVIQVVGGKLR